MSWARHHVWPLSASRPRGPIAWRVGYHPVLSYDSIAPRSRNHISQLGTGPALGHRAFSTVTTTTTTTTTSNNSSSSSSSSNNSSNSPTGAPFVGGRPLWKSAWVEPKQAFSDLIKRRSVPGSPPAVPGKRGRSRGSKSRPRDIADRTAQDQAGLSVTCGYDGPPLSPEQARVVELAAQGRNIFYTGSAGCGKSTVLRAVVQRLRALGKRVEVMAPTGKAALAINGTTTWTFAGWNPNSFKVSLAKLKEAATKPSSKARRRFRRADVIIIDEISMVENLHLERLNQVMKVARVKKRFPAEQYPFGGVQVIVTGDFAQLPPVRPFQHCYECGSELRRGATQETLDCRRCKASYRAVDQWAFRSKAWEQCNFAHVHLKTIHRQHDDKFVSMLQKCRLGDPFTEEEVDLLMNHEAESTGAVELYSTRDEVRAVNEREFKRLSTPPRTFKCHDTFVWQKKHHPQLARKAERSPQGWLTCLEEHSLDRQVELKEGMRVVLLINIDLDRGLCNGSQGTIVGWDPAARLSASAAKRNGAAGYGELKREQIAAFEDKAVRPVMWPRVRFTSGEERIIGPECMINELGDDEPYSLLCRTQIPLAPAWALSIHKAQGMTLDRVKVDLSKAFSEGQVYVALSRATSLRGLEVVGDPKGLMVGKGGNPQVRAFYKDQFGL
ncbi:unnamed protein product [Discula destructiva]